MLKTLLICLLFISPKPSFADTSEDVELFMSHFISEGFWFGVRNRGRIDAAYFYATALGQIDVQIADMTRFREMTPAETVQEIFNQQEALVAGIIVEHYGVEYLSDIADFFQTPTGERMLLIAAQEGIFVQRSDTTEVFIERRFESEWNYNFASWTDYLTFQDFTQYSAFTRTPAGAFFIENTWEIRRISRAEIVASPYFFKPNLNQQFVLEILEAEGVVEFRNRFARQTLVREIKAALGQ